MFLRTAPNSKSSGVNQQTQPFNDSSNQYPTMNDFGSCTGAHIPELQNINQNKYNINKRLSVMDEEEQVQGDVNDAMYACAKYLKPYKCKKCPRFQNLCLEGLRLHYRSGHAGVNFMGACDRCRKCNFTTCSRYLLLRHKLFGKCIKPKVDKSSWYSCELCDYKAEFYWALEGHIERLHEGIQKCELCSFETKSQEKLEIHIQRKHTTYKCEYCGSTYKTCVQLQKHVYKCCRKLSQNETEQDHGNQTISQEQLKIYIQRQHTKRSCCKKVSQNERKSVYLSCKFCSFQTKHKYALKMHTLVKHTDADKIQWFKCRHCNYKTKTQNNIRYHEKGHFSCFKCELCHFQTKYKSSLKKHVLSKHPKGGEMQDNLNRNDESAHKDQNPRNLSVNDHQKIFDIDSLNKNMYEDTARQECSLNDHVQLNSSNIHVLREHTATDQVTENHNLIKLDHIEECGIENIDVLIKHMGENEIEKFNLNAGGLTEHKYDLSEELFCLNMPELNKNGEDQTEENQNPNLHHLDGQSLNRSDQNKDREDHQIEEQFCLNIPDQNKYTEVHRIEENQNLNLHILDEKRKDGEFEDRSSMNIPNQMHNQIEENQDFNLQSLGGHRDDQIKDQNQHREENQIEEHQNLNVPGLNEHRRDDQIAQHLNLNLIDLNKHREEQEQQIEGNQNLNVHALSDHRENQQIEGHCNLNARLLNESTDKNQTEDSSSDVPVLKKRRQGPIPIYPKYDPNALSVVNVVFVQPAPPKRNSNNLRSKKNGGNNKTRERDTTLKCSNCKTELDPYSELSIHIKKLCKKPVPKRTRRPPSPPPPQPLSFQLHIQNFNSEVCIHCKTRIDPNTDMNRHTQKLCIQPVPKEPVDFCCKSCSFRTRNENIFKHHVLVKHADGDSFFQCEFCSFKTTQKGYLKKHVSNMHIKDHQGEWFGCEDCGYKTRSKSTMSRHVKTHQNKHADKIEENIDWLECEYCKYKFKDQNTLAKHANDCAKVTRETFSCEFCPYRTKCQPYLEKHTLETHTEQEKNSIGTEERIYDQLKEVETE